MKLTDSQSALLSLLSSNATKAGIVNFATLFTDIPSELSADIVVLEGEGFVAFSKSGEGVEKANSVCVTDEGWSELALVEATANIAVPVNTPEIQELKKQKVTTKNAQGDEVQASHLQMVSTKLRQSAVQALKQLSPPDYEEYKARKFKGVAQGGRPSLDQSKAAYVWAFTRFLEISYTESGI